MTSQFASLPFGLGDVLVLENGEEAWLAGALVCAESAPIAFLFRAPSGGQDRAVYLRAVPPVDAYWLDDCSGARAHGPLEPPTSLEHAGEIYARARRLPVAVSRTGEVSFDLEGTGILAEYRGPADRRLVRVATREAVLVCAGRVLLPGAYDRFPGVAKE